MVSSFTIRTLVVGALTAPLQLHHHHARKNYPKMLLTDRKRGTILIFLVNSPKVIVFFKFVGASNICRTTDKNFEMIDVVVEEVGQDNVVQVVTDNSINYKAYGDILMRKKSTICSTPCVTHCVDLMLEYLEKNILVHEDTIPKGATRFVTSYLTLGCLYENKKDLIRMFTSKEWKSRKCSKLRDGKTIVDVVLDKKNWKNIVICLRGVSPLIKVLRLVD
ncbi:unnamed protein product [Vicia faba]|uniref:DUF659 domain-containing protein n=1 Tax=Vicia faba TaxID=3906 RepID=A0AAV1B3K6_VICFA|nr:unnamed protein product [Vicia faba]